MWRPVARRALIHSKRRFATVHSQIPNRQAVTRSLDAVLSASSFSIFTRTYHFHKRNRFFTSGSAVTYEEPLFSAVNDVTDGLDISEENMFDDGTNSEFGFGDESIDNVEVDEGFGEAIDGAISTNEGVDSLTGEDKFLGQAVKNDAEAVESLLSLLQSSGIVDGSLEPNLEEMKLVLDQELMLKVLETPHVPRGNLISFFRWVLNKPEFKVTTPVIDSLVSAICLENCKREGYDLWDLVKEVGGKEKGLFSTESLNKLVALFSRLGKGKAALDVFRSFEEFGCQLNADSYYLTIEALCKRSFYSWACSVCEKMLNEDKLPDAGRIGKIISYLCKGGMTKDAHLVYLYAKDKKISPSRSSISFLINSFSRIEKADKGTKNEIDKERDKANVSLALEMLNDYSSEDRRYAVKPFSNVVKKLCWIEDVDRAKSLVLEMISSGPPPGNEVFNCLINGLTKAGDMQEALNMIELMKGRGLKPDVYTYSVMISGYARAGEMEEACEIFDEAKSQHSKLSPVTFHSLIRGFCKLEQFDKAVNLLGEMKFHEVEPNHDEYNKLIKSICFTALDWETAEKLREDMEANGVILNGRTRALIRAVKELKEGVGYEIGSPAQITA